MASSEVARNVTLRQLRALVAVAKTGSFTSAADRLHITQSALSGLVRDLEQTLGVQLVHRTTRSVKFSQIGSDFLPLAERILDDLQRALLSISELKSLNAGKVRIAAPQLMACTLLPQAVASFAKRYPKIEVQLVDCQVDDVVSRVLSGEADLGIGPERASSDEVVADILLDTPFLAVFPPGHALENRSQVSWAELVRYPLISLRGEYARILNNDLLTSQDRVEFTPTLDVAFMTTALSMVSAGLGVTTCLPYASSLLDLYGLRRCRLVEPVVKRKFCIFRRSDRNGGPAVQEFANFLFEYAREHDWT
jgi:DNA-binding transcriptional LysR family regulator